MFLKMKVVGLTMDPFTNAPIVILKDLEDKNALPIWIGLLEASAIASEIEKVEFARPMTHDLMREILKCMDVNVTKIEVNDLRDNVYYATIHMERGGDAFRIDARPSDAIALALRVSSPIYVDAKVLDKSKSIDLRGKQGEKKPGSHKDWLELLEDMSPDAFGKYKM
ncbi:MAG: bifunctional nuclease family protein [Deltaproteobacteria bacterium]|nr:bifunctional nuclease family protein [Deltaproteobacteria bacterium]